MATDAGRHTERCRDLLDGRLACAAAPDDRAAALAAVVRHFAAVGLPVHVVAADAGAADAAHRQLQSLGVAAERLDPRASLRARRRQYAAAAAVTEVLPWARDLLHDTAVVGERPRTVQMLLERGVANDGAGSRLDRALLPGCPVLVVLDPQVTLLDGAQVPVALQMGRARPGEAPDAVVQRSVQALMQRYRHVCGLTDTLARQEADELAVDARLPMGRTVPRWAPAGWPQDAPWRWAPDEHAARTSQLGWARAVVQNDAAPGAQAWLLCALADSACSLQKWVDDAGLGTLGVRALTWSAAREASAEVAASGPVRTLAVEWPSTPVLALQCLRRWSLMSPSSRPVFDGGIVADTNRIVAAWRQRHGPPSGQPMTGRDVDALLAWQLRERAQARRQMLQNETSLRQLLAFAGGPMG